jgi:enediyne biosynthesis protein E4
VRSPSLNRRSFLCGLAACLCTSGSVLDAFASPPSLDPGFRLVDVTAQAGINFRHNSGAYGGKLLPETLGAGCAFLDYDRDGWQDILLVNGADWPGHQRNNKSGPGP